MADETPDFPMADGAPTEERPHTTLQEWLAFADENDCTALEAYAPSSHGTHISSPCGRSWRSMMTPDCQPSAECLQEIDKVYPTSAGGRREKVLELVKAAALCCERWRDYEATAMMEGLDLVCKIEAGYLGQKFRADLEYWVERFATPTSPIAGAPSLGEKEAMKGAKNVARATGGPLWFPFGSGPSAEGQAWIWKQIVWFHKMSAAQLLAVVANHGGMEDPDPAWWTPRLRAIQTLPQTSLDNWALCQPEKIQALQSINLVLHAALVSELAEQGVAAPPEMAQIPKTFVNWKSVEESKRHIEEKTTEAIAENQQWIAESHDRDLGQAQAWLDEICAPGAYDRTVSKAFGRYLAICNPDGSSEIQLASLGEVGPPVLVTVAENPPPVEDEDLPALPAKGLPLALLWGGAGFLLGGPVAGAAGAAAGLLIDAQKGQA